VNPGHPQRRKPHGLLINHTKNVAAETPRWLRKTKRLDRWQLSSELSYDGLAKRRLEEQTSPSEPHCVVQGASSVAALQGEKTLAKLVQQFDVHANQIAPRTT